MKTVYLSLGSNLGEREQLLQDAIELLESPEFQVTRVSSVYETDPLDRLHQPKFLNLVLEAESALFPLPLLAHVQKVENSLGRKRTVPKGPRTMDIDIVFFGAAAIDTPRLVIPHPRAHQRRFVLEPLAELAPGLRHPVTRQTVAEMLSATLDQAVCKVSFRPELPLR